MKKNKMIPKLPEPIPAPVGDDDSLWLFIASIIFTLLFVFAAAIVVVYLLNPIYTQ